MENKYLKFKLSKPRDTITRLILLPIFLLNFKFFSRNQQNVQFDIKAIIIKVRKHNSKLSFKNLDSINFF